MQQPCSEIDTGENITVIKVFSNFTIRKPMLPKNILMVLDPILGENIDSVNEPAATDTLIATPTTFAIISVIFFRKFRTIKINAY